MATRRRCTEMSGIEKHHGVRASLGWSAADGIASPDRRDVETVEDALDFVLLRVSSTMLGRKLTFSFHDDASLTVEVAGRRLIRVLEPLPAVAQAESEILLDANRSGHDVEWTEALARTLRLVAEKCGQISLTYEPLGHDVDPMRKGITAEKLASALDTAFPRSVSCDPEESLERFMELAGDSILCAKKVLPDGAAPICGSEEDLLALSERANSLLPDEAQSKGRIQRILGSRGLLVLGDRDAKTPQLIVGALQGVFLVALSTVRHGQEFSKLWITAQSRVR